MTPLRSLPRTADASLLQNRKMLTHNSGPVDNRASGYAVLTIAQERTAYCMVACLPMPQVHTLATRDATHWRTQSLRTNSS